MADEEEYLQLKDLRIGLDHEALEDESDFSLCLWLYLPSSAPPSSIIIHQKPSERENEVPFLALDEKNKLCLFPLMFLHKEAPPPGSSWVWMDIPHIRAEIDCPREKWVHIGCEVAANRMRLHVDGTLIREKPLSVLSDDQNYQDNLKKIALIGNDEINGKLQPYVYDLRLLPISASTKDHFIKNPPVKLTLDDSCISDGIEEGGDGVWSIVGGKLSSKSDNRLFRVHFDTTGTQKYPFLEAYSHPIRCISRNRTLRPSVIGRRPFSAPPLLNEIHPPGGSDRPHVSHDADGGGPFRVSTRRELKCSPLLKRFKVDHDKSPTVLDTNGVPKQDDRTAKKSLEIKSNNLEGTDNAPSDSESTDAGNSESRWTVHTVTPISDATIFRYCLEGLCERAMLLKDIINSASNEDIDRLATQVCLYTGCSHHRYQILMSKQLIQEESGTWNSISGNSCRVLWKDAVPEINKQFMRISRSTTRSLSGKDLEVLRGIAGCGEDLSRANFEKMWYWLYPVAFSLSNNRIYNLWECARPLWIEGLITKEEAENSLKEPQKPGTFVLRFPTSRSWPHPDAGSLVVTYVGADYTLHHKLLSLDLSSEDNGKEDSKQLQTMLLEEPELSQLARVTQHGMPLAGAEGQV